MLDFITSNLLWTQATPLIIIFITLGIIGGLYFRPLFFITILFFAASFYFFRNPERMCPERMHDTSIIVCPADGKVVDLQYAPENSLEGYSQKISIFLSPLDVHVNWIPIDGTIERITYYSGTFMLAFLPKSSLCNEHNDIVIRNVELANEHQHSLKVRQIAGFVARRICCWVHEHQSVSAGHKYGMIKFGSRVDIFLPSCAEVAVKVGDRVFGGATILGRWKCLYS